VPTVAGEAARPFSCGWALVSRGRGEGARVEGSMMMTDRGWLAVVVLCVWVVSVGCKPGPGGAGSAATGGAGMQVVAMAAERRPVTETVSLVGTVTANEEVELKAEVEGGVEEIGFEEGQRVERGQLLVRLEETKLAAELADAEARLKLALADFERARQLLDNRLISQQEYDQAASTYEAGRAAVELRKRLLRDTRVYAPFSGYTGARLVSPGQVISRNTVLTWLVDLDPVKVEMNIPERFLSQVRQGQRIGFEVAAYPGRRFEGEVFFVAPRLDLATRTALVKTRVGNPEGLLKAGMVANVELELKLRDAALLVPEVALISNGDAYFLFVAGEGGQAEFRPVTVGQRLPRWVEIREGIEPGELVVVEGHQKIGPGMPLKLAPPEKSAIYRTLGLRLEGGGGGVPTNGTAAGRAG
jgi:membrane fusion protein, multidrug efflux system